VTQCKKCKNFDSLELHLSMNLKVRFDGKSGKHAKIWIYLYRTTQNDYNLCIHSFLYRGIIIGLWFIGLQLKERNEITEINHTSVIKSSRVKF